MAMAFMFRTRFAKDIVTEFLPPSRPQRKDRVIILCDGMPSVPRKQPLATFLSNKGFWVFYPRYWGAWESDGVFLAKSPHLDVLDVITGLEKPIREASFGERFKLKSAEISVIGGSFGGTCAILCSLDPRVKRVVANCPVVDWSILKGSERAETSNPSYAAYIREAFGNGYRLSDRNWRKLYSGTFYNPKHLMSEIDRTKILMFHAKDDPYVPWESVHSFAESTEVALKLLSRGGHLRTEYVVQRYWPQIRRFLSKS